jgi:16S rRNA (cytosine967-C5)-methyltransferase
VGGQKPREIAVSLLEERERRENYIEDIFEQKLLGLNVTGPDRALLQELVYGVVRWEATLDWLISRKTSGRTQKSVLRTLLRLGLYQIFWLTRIPDHAAVHETVELGKQLGFGPQAGFINAVLRGYIREKEQTLAELAQLKSAQPAIGLSHPEWLYQKWAERWGQEKTRELLEWNNRPAPTYARVNRLKTTPNDLIARWQLEEVEASMGQWDWVPEAEMFEIKKHPPLSQLGSFQDGWFYVQDPSTLLSVQSLAAKPEEEIADLCAAPGGKTCFIAQRMQNRGTLVAHDHDEARLRRITENCQRLGVTNVQVTADRQEVSKGQFDRVLLDAPCSNSGVMRRRVDLRWRLRASEISRLAGVQNELLEFSAPLLKLGGTLTYSTCSIEPEENQNVVQAFAQRHPEFTLNSERQLLPFQDNVDGAYVAVLQRAAQ